MPRTRRRSALSFVLLAALLPAGLQAQASAPAQTAAPAAVEKVSRFGEYRGYSEAVYDSWVRSSRYVAVRDGTRLAVDVIRPARGGKVAEERLPVVWTHHRYRRAVEEEGKIYSIVDGFEWLQEVVRHGYVVAAVDVRGSGASFGSTQGMFQPKETEDAYDITEWLAAQPWSNGNVGMYGRSYLSTTQYLAMGQKPPHLKAIFPEVGMAHLYDLLYQGGIFHQRFLESWNGAVHEMDLVNLAVPVDEDLEGKLLAAAVAEHKANGDTAKLYLGLPFRDSVEPKWGYQPYVAASPLTYLQEMRESKVAVYHLAGWFDRYLRDQVILFKNLGNPQKLTIGPWSHVQDQGLDFAAEHLRWWDYWLKGIDNGVMAEPAVHYYALGAPEGQGWRAAKVWPLPEERRTEYFFAAGQAGSVKSANDGGLGTEAPKGPAGKDDYTVDYGAGVWPAPRWSLEADYAELTANDAKGLTYTTTPLAATVEVTGHPVVHLWVSSSTPDADLFVYLEEVDAAGVSRYVTEGALRASHRALSKPAHDTFGLPYHRSHAADLQEMPKGEAVELVFDLFPTSNLFDAGNRIRVTVTGADRPSHLTPELTPAPRLTIHRSPGKASRIVLPVIPRSGPS